jgi:hypothetical protein
MNNNSHRLDRAPRHAFEPIVTVFHHLHRKVLKKALAAQLFAHDSMVFSLILSTELVVSRGKQSGIDLASSPSPESVLSCIIS